jgi:hypothetical protein
MVHTSTFIVAIALSFAPTLAAPLPWEHNELQARTYTNPNDPSSSRARSPQTHPPSLLPPPAVDSDAGSSSAVKSGHQTTLAEHAQHAPSPNSLLPSSSVAQGDRMGPDQHSWQRDAVPQTLNLSDLSEYGVHGLELHTGPAGPRVNMFQTPRRAVEGRERRYTRKASRQRGKDGLESMVEPPYRRPDQE